ncbi:hypothetical protein MLD38_027573 [Melastoma candidum]|uniref:Uncharacterized protein n=1 Tax=Melastoma candidum TaxID=119954 RepID=A0ACB9P3H3_9MYRT|nr:hypothetical protein MLD38_027573 [Melastoma candidum]
MAAAIKLFGATITLEVDDSLTCDHDLGVSTKKKKKTRGDRLNKPSKIVPCPRCKSTETKFCYFNNYNVDQPRHFCKGCHRYWTAGGALRNVPVPTGRRKSKDPSPSEPCLAAGAGIYDCHHRGYEGRGFDCDL